MGKVLLVDDNRDFLEALKATMEAAGFSVELANSGFEALTLIKSDSMQIDCVLTDYQMPEMTGDELATAIKHKSSIPVIIMTGNIDIPVDKVFKSGISGVIHKPFDSRHFIDFLKNNDLHIGQDLNKSRKLLRQTSILISQKIQISNGRRSIEGDIFNISSGGIGISLVESFHPMSTVQFNFSIDGHEVAGFMHSRWTAKEGDRFLAGFEFDSTTKKALSLNTFFGKWITISNKAK